MPTATNVADVSERLAARLARQAVLTRDDPPAAWSLVDEAALRRYVGSAGIMAAQLAHLAGVARLPNVTIQVVPNIEQAGLLGGFAAAERAAYVETAVSSAGYGRPYAGSPAAAIPRTTSGRGPAPPRSRSSRSSY